MTRFLVLQWVILIAFLGSSGNAFIGCAQTLRDADEHKASPCEQADKIFNLAVRAYQEHKLPSAMQQLTRAENLCPTDERIANLFGLMALQRRDFMNAEERFKHSIGMNETYMDAYNNLAAVYMAQERWQDAINMLAVVEKDLLYNYPHLVHVNLCICNFKLGELDKAEQHCKEAVYREDAMCLAWYYLGLVAKQQEQWELAQEYFAKSIRKNAFRAKSCEHFLGGVFELAFIKLRFKEEESAIPLLRRCVQMAPAHSREQRECKRALRMSSGAN